MADRITNVMLVPVSQTSALVGRGAEKIMAIQNRTGTRIFVEPEVEPGSAVRAVRVSGPATGVSEAVLEIQSLLAVDLTPPSSSNIIFEKIYVDEVFKIPGLSSDSRELYLSEIPLGIGEEDLHALCQRVADVDEVFILRDTRNASKGAAYVVFASPSEARAALRGLDASLCARPSLSEAFSSSADSSEKVNVKPLSTLLNTRVMFCSKSLRGFGSHWKDPRTHLAVYYDARVNPAEMLVTAAKAFSPLVQSASLGLASADYEMDQVEAPRDFAACTLPVLVSLKAPLAHVDLVHLQIEPAGITLFKSGGLGHPDPGRRVMPVRWSAEGEPIVVLADRESGASRLAIARGDVPSESWPTLADAEVPNLSTAVTTPIMLDTVLFLIVWQPIRPHKAPPTEPPFLFQVNRPTEPWTPVRELSSEWHAPVKRVSVFYMDNASFVLVQEVSGLVTVRRVENPRDQWRVVLDVSGLVPFDARVQFMYIKTSQTPHVVATWVHGADLLIARVTLTEWQVISVVPFLPLTRLACVYPPFLNEPLLIATSTDAKLNGMLQVWRLYLSERLSGVPCPPPVMLKQLGVPRVRAAVRDLSLDYPLIELASREFNPLFFGHRLPFEASPSPPHVAPSQLSVSLLLSSDSTGYPILSGLHGHTQLDMRRLSKGKTPWATLTPLRWSNPQRDAFFLLGQDPASKVTAVISASAEGFSEVTRFGDSGLPFSECSLLPLFARVPGKDSEELFILVLHRKAKIGGVFTMHSPREEWRFVRALEAEEGSMLDPESRVDVCYHRGRDPRHPLLLTFLLVQRPGRRMEVRLFGDPFKASMEIARHPLPHPDQIKKFTMLYMTRPSVMHIWPCDVFAAWVANGFLTLVHLPLPDAPLREVYSVPVPAECTGQIIPVYLDYLSEPLILLPTKSGAADLVRLNLIEALGCPGSQFARPKFVLRYSATESVSFCDLTMDAASSWLPAAAATQQAFNRSPLPFERASVKLRRTSIDQ